MLVLVLIWLDVVIVVCAGVVVFDSVVASFLPDVVIVVGVFVVSFDVVTDCCVVVNVVFTSVVDFVVETSSDILDCVKVALAVDLLFVEVPTETDVVVVG